MAEEQVLQNQETEQSTDILQNVSKSPDHVSLYINHSQFAFTPFDIQIIFGKIQGGIGVESTLIEQAIITMSPEHARAFLIAFKHSFDVYVREQQAVLAEQQKNTQAKPQLDNPESSKAE